MATADRARRVPHKVRNAVRWMRARGHANCVGGRGERRRWFRTFDTLTHARLHSSAGRKG
jgi:hypothetical protein